MEKFWVVKWVDGQKKYLTSFNFNDKGVHFNKSETFALEFESVKAAEKELEKNGITSVFIQPVLNIIYHISVDNGLYVSGFGENGEYSTVFFSDTALEFDSQEQAEHEAFESGLINYQITPKIVE